VIVGELGWPLQEDGRPSQSLTQAKSYGVPIVSERRFLEWVGKISPEEQAKAYTTDELAALSKPCLSGCLPFAIFHFRFGDFVTDRSRFLAGLSGVVKYL